LSEQLAISPRYVVLIAGKLRDNGLINAYAGAKGGFSLARESSDISVYDVMALMEGSLSIPECVQNTLRCNMPCKNSNLFDTFNVMKEYLDSYLKMVTFDKLADMSIRGELSDIIRLVESHTDMFKQRVDNNSDNPCDD